MEHLDLIYKATIDDEVATALANALVGNTKLKRLFLDENPSISNDGWRNFFILVQNCNSGLETLSLENNNIDDEVVDTMVDTLAEMSSPKTLNLSNNLHITTTGWSKDKTFFS